MAKCRICKTGRGIEQAWPVAKGFCCRECFFVSVVPTRRELRIDSVLMPSHQSLLPAKRTLTP